MGCTDAEACVFAGIGKRTLYDYQEANPEFSHQKEVLKTNPQLQAKKIQMKDLEDGNSAIAQKVLDRKEGSKVTVDATVDLKVSNWAVEGITAGG